jgi:hypothetical protein
MKGGYEGGRIRDGKISTDTLDVTAQLAGWPTTTVNDATGSQYAYARGDHSKPVLKLPGAAQESSSAATTSTAGFRLNPFFSGWLMGFPKSWSMCGLKVASLFVRKSTAASSSSGDMAMQSSPSVRKRSSKRTSRPVSLESELAD